MIYFIMNQDISNFREGKNNPVLVKVETKLEKIK